MYQSRQLSKARRFRSRQVQILRSAFEQLENRVLLSNTIYVDAGAIGANTGANWTDAYTDLVSALGAATTGTEICVAGGVYKPTSGTDRTISFQLVSGVVFEGGYAGSNGPNPDVRDVAAYPTILSGDIGVVGDNSDNSRHVVVTSGVDGTTVLDGLTITGGNANASEYGPGRFGGGLYNDSGSPTLFDCTFVDNAVGQGGYGAGMYNVNASPTLTDCTFVENWSPNYSNGLGIFAERSVLTVTNSSFVRNHLLPGHEREAIGGGLATLQSTVSMTGCTFVGNESGMGGAVEIILANPLSPQSSSVSNCIFVGNRASSSGGAIRSYDGPTAITNCTFVGNSAHEFGAGAVYGDERASLSNSIVWGNTATDGTQIKGTLTVRYCDVQAGYSGLGNIDADPQFIRNPSPGADATWGTADDDYGDLRPQPSSAVIDAGNNADVPPGALTDIRGMPRIVNTPGVNDPGAIVDMGAYEWSLSTSVVGTPGDDTFTSSASGFTLNGVTTPTVGVTEIVFDGAGGWDTVTVGSNGPPVILTSTQHLQSLTIADGASALAAGSNSVLVARALSIAPTGTLDLADNDLILDYTGSSSLDAVQSLINSARAGGTWTGGGITSAAARLANPRITTLGAMEASDYLALYGTGATFDGEAIDDSAVLVKYTYYGDTNYDDTVTFDDYSRADAGFVAGRTGWLNGDFNGDGVVNYDDYSLIDFAFNTQTGARRPAAVIVPKAPQLGGSRQTFGRSLR